MKFNILVILLTVLPVCSCSECYTEITTLDSGPVDWQEKPTTISDYHTPLIDKGVDPATQSVWYFEVKSCADAAILLTKMRSGVLFEILIGSWSNERISLQYSATSYDPLNTGPTLSCTSFARFWLSWAPDGTISLGAGDVEGLNTYFTTAATPPTAVGGIGINSCWGNNGEWRYGIPSSAKIPSSCPTIQTTDLSSITSDFTSETPTPTATTKVTSTSDAVECTQTSAKHRTNRNIGHFKKETGLQLSALKQIGSYIQCSLLRCAQSCLSHSGCWYFRFNTTGSSCKPCLLYDSSMSSCLEPGTFDGHLYGFD